MRVREVMSSPVVCVPPDMRLKNVANPLVNEGISAAPVVDGDDVAGIVSGADLVSLELAPDPRAHLGPLPEPSAGVPQVVAEVTTRHVLALAEEADVAEGGRLLLERRIKFIPVLRGRRVVGMMARRDLLEVLARRDQDIAGDLEALLAPGLGAPSPYRVTVEDGSVTLTGPADPTSRRLAWLLAREVPEVVEIRFDQE